MSDPSSREHLRARLRRGQARVGAGLRTGRTTVRSRALLLSALSCVALVIAFVPQIHNVLFDFPALREAAMTDEAFNSLLFRASPFAFLLMYTGGALVAFSEHPRVTAITARLDGVVALTVFGLIALVSLAMGFRGEAMSVDPFAPGFFRHLLLVGGAGIAITLTREASRSGRLPPGLAPRLLPLARLLWLFAFGDLLGEAIWARTWEIGSISPRLYTVWGVVHLSALLVVGAHVLDRIVDRPAERVALGTALFLAMLLGAKVTAFEDRPDLLRTEPSQTAWLDAVAARLDAIPPGPVVLVSAAGGGSRAATFALLAYGELSRVGPVGGTLADRILLASTVSGGSLGTAAWFWGSPTAAASRAHGPLPILDNSFTGEVICGVRCPSGLCGWVFEAPFAAMLDGVWGDFNAPLLRGLLLPSSTRGRGVRESWSARQLIREDAWNAANPLWIANATDGAAGTPVLLSDPPMSAELLGAVPPLGATVVHFADRADRVRTSASFPWGMDMPVLPSGARLTDGGVYDNSGLQGLQVAVTVLAREAPQLLDELRERGVLLVEVASGQRLAPPGFLDARLSPELIGPFTAIKRGTLVATDGTAELRVQAIEALLDAPPGRFDHQSFRYLRDVEGGVTFDGAPVGQAHGCPEPPAVDAQPVMTAWALGPADKARVVDLYALAAYGAGSGDPSSTRAVLQRDLDEMTAGAEWSGLELAAAEAPPITVPQESLHDLAPPGIGHGVRSSVGGGPAGAEVAGGPTGAEIAGGPTGAEVAGGPTGAEVAGGPTGAEVAGGPTGSRDPDTPDTPKPKDRSGRAASRPRDPRALPRVQVVRCEEGGVKQRVEASSAEDGLDAGGYAVQHRQRSRAENLAAAVPLRENALVYSPQDERFVAELMGRLPQKGVVSRASPDATPGVVTLYLCDAD